nr:MAG TPA: hypothetical protein [Caudoviricetes sp.]
MLSKKVLATFSRLNAIFSQTKMKNVSSKNVVEIFNVIKSLKNA